MPKSVIDRSEIKTFLFQKAAQYRDEESLQYKSSDLVLDYVNYQTAELSKPEHEIVTNEKAISDALGLLITTVTDAVGEDVGPCVSWRVAGSRSKNMFAFGRRMNFSRIFAFSQGDTSPRTSPVTSPSKRRRTLGMGTELVSEPTPENMQSAIEELKGILAETRKFVRDPQMANKYALIHEEDVPPAATWDTSTIKMLVKSNYCPRLVRITGTTPRLLSYSWGGIFEHPLSGERIKIDELTSGVIAMSGLWMQQMKKHCEVHQLGTQLHVSEYQGDLIPKETSLVSRQQQMEAKIAEEMDAKIAVEIEQRISALRQELLRMAPPVAV